MTGVDSDCLMKREGTDERLEKYVMWFKGGKNTHGPGQTELRQSGQTVEASNDSSSSGSAPKVV